MSEPIGTRERITAAVIRDARAALARPAHLAEGLPAICYGRSFYELEQQTLFTRTWCAVTVASAVPNAGDMLPIDLAGWPILIVRDRDGSIHAYHNVCRHRAMRLLSDPCRGALRIKCPWHSWTYDLTGKLLGTPEIGGAGVHSAEGFDRNALSLKRIAVGQWHDYVFVNLDGRAPPLAQHLRPLDELLANIRLDSLRHGARIDDEYRGNWKLATEGGIEDYHLPFGHPQLNAHLYRRTKPCAADGVFAGGAVRLADDSVDSSAVDPASPRPWNASLPNLVSPSGHPLAELLVFNVFPTGTVLVAADHVMLGMLLPDGPDRTKVELHLYFDGEAADGAAHRPARDAVLAMWHEVLPQDFPFVEGTQATLASRDAAGIRTRFSPYWEQAVLRFQQMVLDAVI